MTKVVAALRGRGTVAMALVALFAGVVVLTIFAGERSTTDTSAYAMAAPLYMTAGAALVTGVLVGCLFGLPQSAAPRADPGAKQHLFLPSNQLQQVSDWLVKILLGAGLTQLGNISVIGTYLGDFVGSPKAAMLIVTYFFVVGLMAGYFVMTLQLAGLIRNAGQDLVGEYRRVAIEYALYQSLYGSAAAQKSAVREAEDYIREGGEGSGDMFGHLACAYGQWYQRELDHGTRPGDPAAQGLLSKALEHANLAVDEDSTWADVFVDLYQADARANDDDWAVFRDSANDPGARVAAFIRALDHGGSPTGDAPD